MTNQTSAAPARPPTRPPARGNKFYTGFLIALLLGYWLLAYYVERGNLSAQPLWPWNYLLNLLNVENPSSLIIFITGLFSGNVLRHLLPVVIGAYFAYKAAVHLVWQLYNFPNEKDARKFLRRLRSSGSTAESPLLVSADTLETSRQDFVILHTGGPGRILIKNSEVAVTEINDSLYRILPGGKHWLHPFEYIHTILDLRPQKRSAQNVLVRTKDGIPLTVTFHIHYRIKQGQPPTRQNPYPFDPAAVRLLAYKITVTDDTGRANDWKSMPLGLTKKMLNSAVKKYRADEILHPRGREDEPYLALSQQLRQSAKAALDNNGIELLDVNIHSVELPGEIEKPYMKHWKMQSDLQIKIDKANSTAATVEAEEKARAEAEFMMIEAILEGIRRARRSGATSNIGEIVALRLVEALEQMAHQSKQARPDVYRPLIPQIAQIHQELAEESSAFTDQEAEFDDGED